MTMTSSPSSRLCDLTVDKFLTALADATPAPGGGSAAALAGALGGALVAMVARLTLDRECYASVQEEMARVRDHAEALRLCLTALVDADAAAYDRVTAAYRLPKDTETARFQRAEAIQQALKGAAEVPLEVAAACADVLGLASQAVALGNRNAAGDAAVAALLAHAGLQGAARNVRINLAGIQDDAFCLAAGLRAAQLETIGEQALAETLAAMDAGD
jgi:formiminotetrahydrofolate cyclodeaminase